ncbi:MAG: glycosyltransferase [Deltaproteobacteria bacterium]|nr:glycosyltransferase [Deltaproteobacteria bacterium]
MAERIPVLVTIDTRFVSGPAKGLLQLYRYTSSNVEPRFVLFANRGEATSDMQRAVEKAGLPVDVLRESFSFDPTLFAQYARFVMRHGARIVQTHGYKPHVLGLAARRSLRDVLLRPKVRWIAFHHGWTAEDEKVKRYHAVDAVTLKRADRVVTVVADGREKVLAKGVSPERIAVIPNAVDRSDFGELAGRDVLRARWGMPADAPVVSVIGRLSHEKAPDVFLESFALVRRRVPNARAWIVGDGPERQRCEERAKQDDLAGSVVFTGHEKQAASYYEASDVLCIPSRSEQLPNVLLEAMLFGTPVVSTRVGGVAEVVADGESAWIVPPEQPESLANALVHALSDRNEAAARVARAKELVATRYDARARAATVEELYKSVLAR